MTTSDTNIPANHPKARGLRLKRVRNLANQARQDFCSRENLNFNTYKGWEIGRHGGLTSQAAKQLAKIFVTYGVICSDEWLLEAKGTAPQVITDFQAEPESKKPDISKKIQNEIQLLRQTYPNLITHQVQNNHMSPFFNKGDYIGGCPQTSSFHRLIGKVVIAITEDGTHQIGTLEHCDKHATLCLFSNINKKHDRHKPKFTQIAPIIWHRKPH